MEKKHEAASPSTRATCLAYYRKPVATREKPNEALFTLSGQYGPLMTLFLGMKTTVVVSSAAMAKEVLKTHDNIFAGRVVIHAAKILSYHKSSIIWDQNGSQWRKFRRICTTELLSPKKLQASEHVRRDSVFQMIRLIFQENSLKGKSVNFADLIFHTGLTMLSNMMFGTKVVDPNDPDFVELANAFSSWVKLIEKPNLADFFPWLGFLGLYGVDRKIAAHIKRAHYFLDLWISNRLARRSRELNDEREKEKGFLDVLLDMRGHDLSLTDIRAIIFDLLVAGSDTTGATLNGLWQNSFIIQIRWKKSKWNWRRSWVTIEEWKNVILSICLIYMQW